MKTDTHFVSHLSQFFSEWEMFRRNFVEKIKPRISYYFIPFRNTLSVWDIAVKFGRGRQAVGDNIILHLSFPCSIIKAIDTNTEYITIIAFRGESWLRDSTTILGYK